MCDEKNLQQVKKKLAKQIINKQADIKALKNQSSLGTFSNQSQIVEAQIELAKLKTSLEYVDEQLRSEMTSSTSSNKAITENIEDALQFALVGSKDKLMAFLEKQDSNKMFKLEEA